MRKLFLSKSLWFAMFGCLVLVLASACGLDTPINPDTNPPVTQPPSPHKPGATDFTTDEGPDGQSSNPGGSYEDGDGAASPAAPSAGAAGEADRNSADKEGAPSGREGEVEEADLYRVHGNLLFYLNTYKGLTLFDLTDPKQPKKLYNLPVYGYPIEMFVTEDTVYALVRDALYLVRVQGKLQFHRHNVSQLITIDIKDPKKPKVLQRFDIRGMLREGVSRKIDDTIYVVSFMPRWYWWGWRHSSNAREHEQATVYSFNVANPRAVQMVQSIELIKNVPPTNQQNPDGSNENTSFSGITISATSNTLLVGETYHYYRYQYNSDWRCSEYEYSGYTVLNVVDISDPKGTIRVHSRFKVQGTLSDQFKQTYIYEKDKKRGVYLGIYQRREWQRQGCQSNNVIRNTLISVDISDGKNPIVLDELVFGKPNETVFGSLFDTDRSVAYAITARIMDPLYAISFKDPSKLEILSEIDGLSGDINLFRFIEGGKFLLAIGRDNSSDCTGFGTDQVGINQAVSIIDVQDLKKIRLVQRKCIVITGARWTHSEINWNLDQAHKMIGMHSLGKTNILTVPVSYHAQSGENDWWWYEYKSAIGIMKWDLSKYDPSKDHTQQNVIENVATMIHPKGAVKRTIILELAQANTSKRRVVANLSDTHISLVDLDDLNNPKMLSTFEIAPYIRSVYRFGDYVVEQVNLGQYYEGFNEFRVKKIGKDDINDTPAVAQFTVGQISRVVRSGDNLLLFRRMLTYRERNGKRYPHYDYQKSQVLIVDLSNPTNPKIRGSLTIPYAFYPYYDFYCGDYIPYYFGYFYNYQWVATSQGLVSYFYHYDNNARTYDYKLLFLNISNPDNPSYSTHTIFSSANYPNSRTINYMGIVPLDGDTFYLSYRKHLSTYQQNSTSYNRYRYYAQTWSLNNGKWSAGSEINLPGQLVRAFYNGKQVRFLSRDFGTIRHTIPQPNSQGGISYRNQSFYRLYLLDLLPSGSVAALRDFRSFLGWDMGQLLTDGSALYLVNYRDWYYLQTNQLDYSQRTAHLLVFDLSKNTIQQKFVGDTLSPYLQLMGVYNQRLFLNLQGDGVLVVDVRDQSKPEGLHFERTLGWLTHVEFSGDKAYLAAGHFGIYTLDLNQTTIPAI